MNRHTDAMDEVIDSANTINEVRGKGLPIGNLTSQFFANLYLNELDRFIKFELKFGDYVRHCCPNYVILSRACSAKDLIPSGSFVASLLRMTALNSCLIGLSTSENR